MPDLTRSPYSVLIVCPLAAASEVEDEPLDAFSGILGLALPPNSVIVSRVRAGDPIGADGATWASNLFGMDGAPASRFVSFLLERPGSTKIPSLLGIGRHPADHVPDPSKVHYSNIVSEGNGASFWKISVTAITVYADGVRKEVNTGPSSSGSAFPTAVLDTGVPVILTTSAIANGIYGALDIHPAHDKNCECIEFPPIHQKDTNSFSDYVPCKTPLNMTISANGVAIPLHPLDLTTGQDVSSQMCIGTIQSADELLGSTHLGDMILGVPFLRSVYTVLAHDVPLANGTFDTEAAKNHQTFKIRPRLGLMSLTDPDVAMDEFHTVRVLGQPLSSDGSTDNGSKHSASGGASNHGLSVGLKVLLGLISAFALALLLFAVRFWWQRRKWNKSLGKLDTSNGSDAENPPDSSGDIPLEGVQSGAAGSSGLTAAQLRDLKLDEYMSRKGTHSTYTVDTLQTKVEPDNQDRGEEMLVDEFGLVYFGRPGKGKKGRNSTASHSFSSFPDQATMVGMGIGEADEARLSQRFGFTAFPPSSSGLLGMEDSTRRRSDQSGAHFRTPSEPNPSEPLLTSQSRSSAEWNDYHFPSVESPLREDAGQGWGEEPGMRDSMVGVGTHNRRRPSSGSNDPARPISSRTRTSSSGLPAPSMPRHSRIQSSFDNTAEDPLLPLSPSLQERRNRA
jgi:hypothetical protein